MSGKALTCKNSVANGSSFPQVRGLLIIPCGHVGMSGSTCVHHVRFHMIHSLMIHTTEWITQPRSQPPRHTHRAIRPTRLTSRHIATATRRHQPLRIVTHHPAVTGVMHLRSQRGASIQSEPAASAVTLEHQCSGAAP
jgi:hypothetical protein